MGEENEGLLMIKKQGKIIYLNPDEILRLINLNEDEQSDKVHA